MSRATQSAQQGAAVLALTGGIGGAKLALGLQGVLAPGALTVVVNTGDDFEHLGLSICPDVDTTLYTLAAVANAELGWGRAAETWSFMTELERLGGESWFRLGDKDLALHIERTRRLAAGERLGAIIDDMARRFALRTRIVPMSDDRVRTMVDSDAGTLSFQRYFVERRCVPVVRRIRYEGAERAQPNAAALALLGDAALAAVIICPSNPYLSIDPMLAMDSWRAALRATTAPVIAVSPLIAGEAVKGPTAKIMRELGVEVSPRTIVAHYADLLDGFVLDEADAALAARFDLPLCIARTLMRSLEDKEQLARRVLEFAQALRSSPEP
ncbi:MAG TPA: 2-phospho-L-lactate transferase [Steroidobacteraceae bacterium]|nr:2-phospho-L-lactate transferase [Steroidobacteraceae bacterium]